VLLHWTGVGCASNNPLPPSVPSGRFGGSGVPDSDRTGLADPPEDWPATSLSDAAAVTPRKPQSREARVWLVVLVISFAARETAYHWTLEA